MSDDEASLVVPSDDPAAIDMIFAVRAGDLPKLRRVLGEQAELARARSVRVIRARVPHFIW